MRLQETKQSLTNGAKAKNNRGCKLAGETTGLALVCDLIFLDSEIVKHELPESIHYYCAAFQLDGRVSVGAGYDTTSSTITLERVKNPGN